VRIIERIEFMPEISTALPADNYRITLAEMANGSFAVLHGSGQHDAARLSFRSLAAARKRFADLWANLATNPFWSELREPQENASDPIRASKQLGMFGAQAGIEIGALTGSQGALFRIDAPARQARSRVDQRIAEQYDPKATPPLF
jgi:hypothetical protein